MMVLIGTADLYINSSPSGIRAELTFWGAYTYVDFKIRSHKTKRVLIKQYDFITYCTMYKYEYIVCSSYYI